MAVLAWAIVFLLTLRTRAQSGDDESSVSCLSTLTMKKNILTCRLIDENKAFEAAALCESHKQCQNASLNGDKFTVHVKNIFSSQKLNVHFKDGDDEEQYINMRKIVKIQTPRVLNVTHVYDEVVIHFQLEHDYDIKPKFQVEIWGDHGARIQVNIENVMKIYIGGDKLRDNDVYRVRVRAKPTDYFDGPWTRWSSVKNFTVNNTKAVTDEENPPLALYIIMPVSILATLISFMVLCWKKEIRAYLFPAVPHPKATLAQIHREKESLPVSFSPDIFRDLTISRVDYAEDKRPASEASEDYDEFCHSDLKPPDAERRGGEEPAAEVETSHLRIKLLSDHTSTTETENKVAVAAVPGYGKDETYVTMSSLYKTQ